MANKRNIRKIVPTCLYASHMTTLAVEGKKSAMMIFILADRRSANTFNLTKTKLYESLSTIFMFDIMSSLIRIRNYTDDTCQSFI